MSTFIDDNSHDSSIITTSIINNNSSDDINNNHDVNNNNNDDDTNEEKEQLALLSFSLDIMSIILMQFLTIYDIGKLDTAYCNRNKRDQLLNILSNNKYTVYDRLSFDKSYKSINKLLIWIGNRKIKILELSNEDNDWVKENLTDNGLLGLSRYCIHLQSLNIRGCYNITDTAMIEISRNCIHLKSLGISGCNNIDTREIQRLFPNVVLPS